MLRDYRWQILALVVTATTFFLVLLTRSGDSASVEVPPTPTTVVQAPTETPTPTAEAIEAPTVIVEAEIVTVEPEAPVVETLITDDVPTYREALVGDVRRLNPLFASLNPVDADITSLIFEGLTTVDEFGDIVPLLAEEWAVSSDSYTYVFRLRDDVLWQDGQPFSARDVIYTLSLLQSPDFPGPEDMQRFWSTVEIQPIDDYLIRFRLAQPLSSFPAVMSIGILPEHALRGTDAAQIASHPFNLSPVGTGPYQLEALRTRDGRIHAVDLRVAPNYRARPEGATGYAVDRLSFRLYDSVDAVYEALAAGEVDGFAARDRRERQRLLSVPGMSLHQTFAPSIGFLVFNWGHEEVPFMADERVRVAMALGLNRASLIDRTLYEQAVRADSPMLRLSWAYNYGDSLGAAWLYQPERALAEMQLAAERFASTDEDGDAPSDATLAFDVILPDDPALVALVNEIAAQWEDIGVQVRAVPLADDVYQSRLESGDFHAAIVEFSKSGSPDPDVYAFWHQGQTHPEGLNYGAANDTAISQSLELARRDSSGTNRRIHYNNFQREFINRVIAIPLYYPLYTYAVTPRLQGVQIGFIGAPQDRFLTISEWEIES